MIVLGVIMHVVVVLHLHEVLLYPHHLVLQGPMRVPEPLASMLNLHLSSFHINLECLLTRWNKR